ncbi:hypothetical protein HMPREF1195_00418 [Streptococcus parasanguinis CC87K]|uniref:Uncharacterized protein n=1 Tax=Streptococcus parasanguinis CC87K TaxID=1073372 RepID=V8BG64_STRPA|nr:NAD glycohydrolase inhibitor [Streptococcus parasanguinis]ETD14098.1 hypothetical protein HMPREF1195_00418 [Streptococcus parasanguinis CC87K]
MKKYEIPEPKDYQSFINFYRNVMREGKEEEAFLGTDAKYRIWQRDSYELDSTDIGVLIEYCLYPLYVEGDRDIARRTFEILKDFSLSNDLMKLKKVTQYISNQKWFVTNYYDIPFVIETDELVRNIIESISKLSDEQKRTYAYERLCNVLDRSPLYRRCDEEKVEKILITFQYSPSDNGLAFLVAVQKTLQNTDMSLKVEVPE